jgi:hypothetical protein
LAFCAAQAGLTLNLLQAPSSASPETSEEVKAMEKIRASLCPECGACPEVVIDTDAVRIGEADNMVRLSHAEWNQLAELVRSGKLPSVRE